MYHLGDVKYVLTTDMVKIPYVSSNDMNNKLN